jgi:hypothetical protein
MNQTGVVDVGIQNLLDDGNERSGIDAHTLRRCFEKNGSRSTRNLQAV